MPWGVTRRTPAAPGLNVGNGARQVVQDFVHSDGGQTTANVKFMGARGGILDRLLLSLRLHGVRLRWCKISSINSYDPCHDRVVAGMTGICLHAL